MKKDDVMTFMQENLSNVTKSDRYELIGLATKPIVSTDIGRREITTH